MPFLLILFIVIPLIEIALFIKLGGFLGLTYTLALVILTAIIGVYLLRRQGMATLLRAREKMAVGQTPAQEMAEGILLAVAGAFLLTPGFFTDTLGFVLLLPAARQLIYGYLKKRIMPMNGAGFSSPGSNDQTFEGEFHREKSATSSKDSLPPG